MDEIIKLFLGFGPTGLIAVIWYLDRKDFQTILKRYDADMQEQRQMYANNVLLVKAYERIASDLHNIVVLNTQVIQKLTDSIQTNQFCPMVRVEINKKPGA